MDYLWIILGVLFLVGGFIGCFLPVIPGPPLAYVSLLFLQLTGHHPFTINFLVIWGFVIALVTLIDYFIPPLATKKFGGSRYGVIGSMAGIVLGVFILPPWGILIFPFIGAYIGELLHGSEYNTAKKAAFGSFIGLISGIVLKVSVTGFIGYYFFTNLA